MTDRGQHRIEETEQRSDRTWWKEAVAGSNVASGTHGA